MVPGRPHGAVALIAERQNAVHRDGGTRLHPRAHGAACVGRGVVSLLSCSVAPFLILWAQSADAMCEWPFKSSGVSRHECWTSVPIRMIDE
jgi:hypothetical protein